MELAARGDFIGLPPSLIGRRAGILIVCNQENTFHYMRVRAHYGMAAECRDPTEHLLACCPVRPVVCSRKHFICCLQAQMFCSGTVSAMVTG